MSDQDGKRVEQVTVETVKLSAMHMAFVLTRTLGEVLSYAPAESRQGLLYVLGAAAMAAVEDIRGDASEQAKAEVRTLTGVYVDNALRAVAKQYGLRVPEVKGDGPKQH
ncbi:hypothetical protein FHR71_004468 [Methylobacterium sp. RAS18]|nr:hypothetical protein [Methylobacterium sp. RAS18]